MKNILEREVRKIRNVSSLLIITVLVFLFSGFNNVEASGTDYYLTVGESTVSQFDSQLEINQSSEQVVYKISKDGVTQIEESNSQMVLEYAKYVTVDEKPALIMFFRGNSAQNEIQFKQYEIIEGTWKETFTSESFAHATYDIVDQTVNLTYTVKLYQEDSIEQIKYNMATNELKTPSVALSENRMTKNESLNAVENNIIEIIGTNPPDNELNRIFTEEAQKLGIPAEIVKAIAYQEGSWAQYWHATSIPITHYNTSCTPEKAAEKNGMILAWDQTNVKLGYDCIGIGVMQVSDWRFKPAGEKEAYIQRLKEDIRFNISEGLKTLKEKWDYHKTGMIPTVNDNNPNYIEHWYFAILAYNGLLERNNPLLNASSAYQEKIMTHMNNLGLLSLSPFPTDSVETALKNNYILTFPTKEISVPHTLNLTKQELPVNGYAYASQNGVNVRSTSNISEVLEKKLSKGQRVKVLGNINKEHGTYKIQYPNSRNNHYYFLPVQLDNGTVGYVASSYIMPEKKVNVLNLSGPRRYETSARVSNVGWHNDLSKTVVLGRGDVPLDALTGSVLAAQKGAPLLLMESTKLTESIAKELIRLRPETIYILGGEAGISLEMEQALANIYPNVIRLPGANRYDTARVVGNQIATTQSVSEVFIALGSVTSTDALAIAPVAGMKKAPILLQKPGEKLTKETQQFIEEHNVTKVTLVGGTSVLPDALISQFKNIGVTSIERVSGKDRFLTSIAVATKYFSNPSGLFFARGDQIVDALSGSSLAAKWNQPIILTKSTSVPSSVQTYIKSVNPAPNVNYLGGFASINEPTRIHIEALVWQ